MVITALYAGLLAPLLVYLSVRVIMARRSERVSVGDGGSATLTRRMRVQANFVEYVPMALILMMLAESMRISLFVLHAAGLALLIGRLLHAYGVSQTTETFQFRIAGTALTLTAILVLSLACLIGAFGLR